VLSDNLKRKHRSALRRTERKLVEEQGLTFRLASEQERLDEDMRTLFRLHDSRWGAESTGIFAGPGADFHLDFAHAALERGLLRLWLAEIDGQPAAAWYGFRFAGVDWHLQSGRDPQFDRLSVGTTLFVHTLRSACEDGMGAYHFLAGDEGYKMRFAEEDAGAESWLIGARPATAVVGTAVRLRGAVLGARARRAVAAAQADGDTSSS
jgi:CelD/BcsL family acetyltransferase involved in cellulose biosynthesis